ncbi:hypothetical protein ACWCPS_33045 [Streptomyces mauvecolor]
MRRWQRQRVTLAEATRHGQQLFLANLHQGREPQRPRPVLAPPEVALRPLGHRQLTLFELPRDLRAGRRAGFPPPLEPAVARRLGRELVDYATTHGWSARTGKRARQGLQVLLALQDTMGAPIPTTLIYQLPEIHLPARILHEFLDRYGLVDDDRTPAIETWFARQIEGLPQAMASELRTWFNIRWHGHDRTPRCLARSQNTVRVELRYAMPLIRTWAATGIQSLREITPARIRIALRDPSLDAHHTIAGLRSVFRTLHRHHVIFTDPTVHMPVGHPPRRTPLPASLPMLRDNLLSPDPARAAMTALLAFHALSAGQIRALQLTDIHDGRLHLPDRTVVLAEPVRVRVSAYLDHRNRTWPNTANPHLFVHQRTALGVQPVGGRWLGLVLGTSARVIRTDRILDEVEATGGDVRRICALFGLSVPAALRYTQTVEPQLSSTATNDV